MREHRRAVAACAVVAAALCSAAVYNGYPLVFSDTAAYVSSSFHGDVPVDRPIAYAAFLRLVGSRRSLWPAVAAQATLCALALWLTLASYHPRRPARQVLGIGLLLASTTALPWIAGQVMPDFLAPLAVLGAFLLLVRWRESEPTARAAAAAMLVFAVAAHYTHLLLVGAITGLTLLAGVLRRDAAIVRGGLRVATALAAGCAVVLAINFRQTRGQLFLTRGGHVFMVGRLIESGILQRLLADHCDRTPYLLCPYRDELRPSLEYFMFDPASPIHEVGGLRMSRAESMRMVLDAVRYYPAAVVWSSLRHAAQQFVTFETGEGLRRYEERDEPAVQRAWVTPVIHDLLPAEYPRYAASRQQRRALALGPVRAVDAVVAWTALAGSAAVLVVAVRARRRGRHGSVPPASDLHAFVWLAAALNAAVAATLTTVAARFQARVVWLFVLACLMTLAQRRLQPRCAQRRCAMKAAGPS